MSVAIPAPSRARMFQIRLNDWSGSAGNYTYTKSDMPTIAAGMNLVLYCDDTDYITTNGLSVTAGAGSITLTATAHPDQLNVLVLPIPEANAAHVVIFPDAYSKGQINSIMNNVYGKSYIDTMFGHLSGLKVYFHDESGVNITPTEGSAYTYVIDLTGVIPVGVSSPWAVLAWIEQNGIYYSLPYVNNNGEVQTWVYGITSGVTGADLLNIKSTTTWTNAHVYMVLITA